MKLFETSTEQSLGTRSTRSHKQLPPLDSRPPFNLLLHSKAKPKDTTDLDDFLPDNSQISAIPHHQSFAGRGLMSKQEMKEFTRIQQNYKATPTKSSELNELVDTRE